MTEGELQGGVIDTAHGLGYLVAHFRVAKTERGWRTPVEADGKGFVDLVLTGRRRVIFAELKNEKRKVEPEQQVWLDALRVAGAEVYLWRPIDYTSGEVERILRGPAGGMDPRVVFPELCAAIDDVLDHSGDNYMSDQLSASVEQLQSLIGPG